MGLGLTKSSLAGTGPARRVRLGQYSSTNTHRGPSNTSGKFKIRLASWRPVSVTPSPLGILTEERAMTSSSVLHRPARTASYMFSHLLRNRPPISRSQDQGQALVGDSGSPMYIGMAFST